MMTDVGRCVTGCCALPGHAAVSVEADATATAAAAAHAPRPAAAAAAVQWSAAIPDAGAAYAAAHRRPPAAGRGRGRPGRPAPPAGGGCCPPPATEPARLPRHAHDDGHVSARHAVGSRTATDEP